jgi:DNA-binding transcriptional LysR family regulator
MMLIQELQLFEHMVVTGSMSETGRELGVSAAVVSKHISALEQRLGTQLFYRPKVRLELTASGRAYYAREIFPNLRRVPTLNTTCAAGDNDVICYRRVHFH